MNTTDQRNHRPISLKWKWSFVISVVTILIVFISLSRFKIVIDRAAHEAVVSHYQEIYDDACNFLSEFDRPFVKERTILTPGNQSKHSSNEEAIQYLQAVDSETINLRLFNDLNQLIYMTRNNTIPSINHSGMLTNTHVKGEDYFVAFQPIYHKESDVKIGSLQMIVKPQGMIQFLLELQRYYYLILIITCVAFILAAIILSHRFLKPLTSLNSALDMIEEENLSQIRMMRLSSKDEWSELNIHVNSLLDKLDKYVTGQKQFVEDVSHELRTPVAIVQGHLKLLDRWGKEDPEILEESIASALQEISRMQHLVQEMLDLSRADNVNIDYKDEITEIYSTTEQVFNNFKLIHEDFDFYMDSDMEGQKVYVQAFRNHIEQVLIILLDNAVKYSKDRKEIHVSVSKSVTQVEITVQDFGEGMTEKDKERVFSRFYRVDKSRVREKGGNGLGLSIAQQLIRGYKGDIRVESVYGNGSIFYITLPIMTDPRQIYRRKQIAERRNIK